VTKASDKIMSKPFAKNKSKGSTDAPNEYQDEDEDQPKKRFGNVFKAASLKLAKAEIESMTKSDAFTKSRSLPTAVPGYAKELYHASNGGLIVASLEVGTVDANPASVGMSKSLTTLFRLMYKLEDQYEALSKALDMNSDVVVASVKSQFMDLHKFMLVALVTTTDALQSVTKDMNSAQIQNQSRRSYMEVSKDKLTSLHVIFDVHRAKANAKELPTIEDSNQFMNAILGKCKVPLRSMVQAMYATEGEDWTWSESIDNSMCKALSQSRPYLYQYQVLYKILPRANSEDSSLHTTWFSILGKFQIGGTTMDPYASYAALYMALTMDLPRCSVVDNAMAMASSAVDEILDKLKDLAKCVDLNSDTNEAPDKFLAELKDLCSVESSIWNWAKILVLSLASTSTESPATCKAIIMNMCSVLELYSDWPKCGLPIEDFALYQIMSKATYGPGTAEHWAKFESEFKGETVHRLVVEK